MGKLVKTFDKATEILRRHRNRKYHKKFITDMVSFLTSLILINTLTEVYNYIFNYNYSSQFYLQFLKTTAKYMCWWSKDVTVISLRIYSYIYIQSNRKHHNTSLTTAKIYWIHSLFSWCKWNSSYYKYNNKYSIHFVPCIF